MPLIGEQVSVYFPPVPGDLNQVGLPSGLVTDLILRRLSIEGTSGLENLGRTLKLPIPVVHAIFTHLRQQQLCEVKGMVGNDYRICLSGSGRAMAAERFQISQYSGAAPVSLRSYCAAVKAQAAEPEVNRQVLQVAFSDMVTSESLLDQLGPALIEHSSIFLYGPPGNGKTSIAERLLRVYQDAILIPYAVEVDGQVISVYDPIVHKKVGEDDRDRDPRWVLCQRPCIMVGGELAAALLELHYDDASGIYSAPLQMKANNGIFIIDDFGRQQMSPRELLNRWIVPLDRRVDYLSLRYGLKFEIPFEVLVVFSTNIAPKDLADEAFLRRIHNKIQVGDVSPDSFDEIFRRVAKARKVGLGDDSLDTFRRLCLADGGTELRACYPNDVCKILMSIARYEDREPVASDEDLSRAVQLYFAAD